MHRLPHHVPCRNRGLVSMNRALFVLPTRSLAPSLVHDPQDQNTQQKATDLVGTGCFAVSAIATFVKGGAAQAGGRAVISTSLITAWSTRLASFLFYRIWMIPEDNRLSKASTRCLRSSSLSQCRRDQFFHSECSYA